MELNEYQKRAMSTCLPSCKNALYMITGLSAEVGEVNDKVAKDCRRGELSMQNNHLVYSTSDENVVREKRIELMKELGDIVWFAFGLADVLGFTADEVCQMNLDKLAERKRKAEIITHKDH